MKLPLAFILLALVVVGTGLFVKEHVGSAQAATDNDSAESVERLSTQVVALEAQVRELSEALDAKQPDRLVAPTQRTQQFSDSDIDAAVARWMEANATDLIPAEMISLSTVERSLAELSVDELLELLRDDTLTDGDQQELWKQLSKLGRFDEVLAGMEALAAASPFDPDLQVELANSYLQKIFDVGAGPLAGKYGMLADNAFAKAIELDDQHIEARLVKAISLSEWPAFFNKTPQAIAELEELVEIQADMPPEQQAVLGYLILGNLQLQSGNLEAALAAWRQGLIAFPNNADLLSQVQLNE